MRYKILSLLDITKTMARRNRSDNDKAVNQYANYMTFENSLQLRSNVDIVAGPVADKMDISNLKFGDAHKGEHTVWTTVIEPDFPDAVKQEFLEEDFDLIPMIIGLDETINIKTGVFRTTDPDYTNILFIKQIDNEA